MARPANGWLPAICIMENMNTQCIPAPSRNHLLSLDSDLCLPLQITLTYVPALFLHLPSKLSNRTFPPQSERTFNAQTHP
jgi:hypothetical protein